jgi:hypothetical protein
VAASQCIEQWWWRWRASVASLDDDDDDDDKRAAVTVADRAVVALDRRSTGSPSSPQLSHGVVSSISQHELPRRAVPAVGCCNVGSATSTWPAVRVAGPTSRSLIPHPRCTAAVVIAVEGWRQESGTASAVATAIAAEVDGDSNPAASARRRVASISVGATVGTSTA